MQSIFDFKILDNTIGSYLFVTGCILLAIAIKRFISKYVAGLAFRMIRKVTGGVDRQSFINLVVSPLDIFLVILVVLVSLDRLQFPQAINLRIHKTDLHGLLDSIGTMLIVASFIWLLLRIIDFVAMILKDRASISQSQSDNQLVVFFKDFFKALLIIVGVLMILKFGFNFNVSSLITGLSLAGAAVALATKESIENLIASFIIFFDRPFSTGDLIKVQSITGTVEKIGLRSTRLRTTQKTYVTVPNKQMVDSILDNLTLQTQRRAFVQLELHGDTPQPLIEQFVRGVEDIVAKRSDRIESHTVFLADIAKNAYVVTVEFFTATIPISDFNALRQHINLSVIGLMESMQIRLASKDSGKEAAQ